jgi:hypothetical protein
MNFFQKIREVKLPFLAVIGALVFGGIVAPANAAAVPSNPAITLNGLSANLSFDVAGYAAGSTCRAVARLSSLSDLDQTALLGRTSMNYISNGDAAFAANTATGSSSSEMLIFSALQRGTSYKYFLLCHSASFADPSAVLSGTFVVPGNTPAATGLTYTYNTTTTGTLSFSASENGTCYAVARLNSAAALTNANKSYIVTTALSGTPGSSDQAVAYGNVTSGVSRSLSLSGMTSGSSYTVYVACQDVTATATSNLYSYGFTHQLGGGGVSYSACNPALTVTSIGYANGRTTLAPGESYSRVFNNDPSIVSSNGCAAAFAGNVAYGYRATLDGVQIYAFSNGASSGNIIVRTNSVTYETLIANPIFNGRTISQGSVYTISYYVGLTTTPTSSDTPTFSFSLILNPNGGGSSPTTAAVQRPLPQINFAANPVNGVSARPTADTRKGTLTIEGSNLSDLTSITIGGKAATFTVKDGKLDIKLPAGVTGFPEVVMTNASGSITMQNAIEIYAPTVQKLTRFVGERLTLAGMEALENLYIDNKTATALEATVVVAPDATEAEIAKAVKAATKAVTYIDKVGKRIVRTAVTVSKTGEAGTKPSIEMSFTK